MIPLSEDLRGRFREACGKQARQFGALLKHAGGDAFQFAQLLIQHGYLDRDSAGSLIGDNQGWTYVNLGKTLFQQEVVAALPREMALRLKAIPLYKFGDAVTVAMLEPGNGEAARGLEIALGAPVSPVFSFPDEIESAIKVNYQSSQAVDELVLSFDLSAFSLGEMSESKLRALVESERLVEIADSLLLAALKERASDIHLEPKKAGMAVRFRVDGVMAEKFFLPRELALPLISRYKVISGLDITERRRPQDGRLNFSLPTKSLDLRVSTLPTLHGEKMVMRILGSVFTDAMLNLDKLDFAPEVLTPLKEVVGQPDGILFVTGPTGSGKTTTLYAALNYINKPDINVVTIEDPIEYDIPSINQVMVHEKVGRSFQAALRAVLRQDPDVILVGEIRDAETARIAVQAALTGHLVLTTLHTGDAIQASTRLLEMGIEGFFVAPSIIGVLNQRLVRRICERCKRPHEPDQEYLRRYFHWRDGFQLPPLYRGEGCENCGGTGFYGRLGIHEFLRITPLLREAILLGKQYGDIRDIALQEGFRDVRYDGFKKALRGQTTIEEVVRVTASDI